MKNGNLLIIDDEKLLVQNIKYLLSEYVEKIFCAYNGQEGLGVLEKEDIHCVICDISMPIMGGVELIKKVRESGNEVPFIFYTAFGHEELMMEVAKFGAFDFLKKPDFEGLEEIVSRGIREGFRRKTEGDLGKDELLTEYQKILEELSKT